MVKIHKRSIIQKEKWLVKVPSNSELEITKFPNVGIWLSNKCRKDKWQKFCVQLIWIKVEVEIISDKVEQHGSRKDKPSHMNLKYIPAKNNLSSQKMKQLSQRDACLLP